MSEASLQPFTRHRIARLAEDVLTRAGVLGVLPTSIEALAQAVGVRERIDMSDLPTELIGPRPVGWQQLLGAVMLQERTIFVDGSQPRVRRRFTEAHEIGHLMCTWHEAALMLDTEQTLFRASQDLIEAEANYAAGYLLFQGDRFHRRALAEGLSLAVPLRMAAEYDASLHSTMHFYVEGHPAAVALLVAGRYPDAEGRLPIWRTIESSLFLRRFGPLPAQLASGRRAVVDAVGEILAASRRASEPPSTTVALTELGDGALTGFRAEAFFNGRCYFVLLAERPRVNAVQGRATFAGTITSS